MSNPDTQFDNYVLSQIKPVCYGLAIAAFGFVLQAHFSLPEGKTTPWQLYPLAATILPLFGFGVLSDLFKNSHIHETEPRFTKCFVKLFPWIAVLNLFGFSFAISALDPGLCWAFSAGTVIMILMEIALFHLLNKTSSD